MADNKKVYFLYSFVLLCAVFIGIAWGFLLGSLFDLDGIKLLERYKPSVATQIFDVNNRLIGELYQEKRELISYDVFPPHLIEALISTEDRNFFDHYGISIKRILKAIYINIFTSSTQGASTLTMQLSKWIFLTPERTLKRKIKELWYVMQIEKQYTKKEILAYYLNQVYFGHGCYGISAASKFYFNKEVSDLNVFESAILVGLLKSPSRYSPLKNQENCISRQKSVLNAMIANDMLSEKYLDNIDQFWLTYNSIKINNRYDTYGKLIVNKAPFFTEYIRQRLKKEFTEEEIYNKGLKVYTTIDIRQQQIAQKILKNKLEEQNAFMKKKQKQIDNILHYQGLIPANAILNTFGISFTNLQKNIFQTMLKNLLLDELEATSEFLYLFNRQNSAFLSSIEKYVALSSLTKEVKAEGSIVSINPNNGFVTTMVGGSEFSYNNQLNRSVSIKRQIGSLMKPFIYGLGFEQNIINPSTIIKDSPKVFEFFNHKNDLIEYIPKNYNGKYKGDVTARIALKQSINIAAIDVLHQVGVEPTRNTLADIFRVYDEKEKRKKFPNNLTLVLGSGIFSPIEMATAFAVLVNGGKEVVPKTIRYIASHEGKLIKNYETRYDYLSRFLSEDSVYLLVDILKDVFTPGGTGYKPKLLKDFIHRPDSFGKTGTSSDWKDAWFVGANQYLSTAVWVGYDDNRSLGKGRAGGTLSAPIWIEYQKEVLKNKNRKRHKTPENIISKRVCYKTGHLESSFCDRKNVYSEIFKKDNIPKRYCNFERKQMRAINKFQTKIIEKKQNSDIEYFLKNIEKIEKE